jgi:hypothetical protein
MAFLAQVLGRIIGYAFLYGLTAAAMAFTGAILLGALVGERADDIGTQRIACLVGWQMTEEPCPRLDDAAARARAEAAALRSEVDALQAEYARLRALEARTDSFTLFRTEAVPALSGYEVTAGSRYASLLEAGQPADTYCYVLRSAAGVTEQVTVAQDGRPSPVTANQATRIGLTLAQIDQARAACRYAHEEGR